MTNISLAGKMLALRKSIHLHRWDAPRLFPIHFSLLISSETKLNLSIDLESM